LETIDFTDRSKHDAVIEQTIECYFPNDESAVHYRAQAKRMIEALLNVDLGDGWMLKDIDRSARVSELEFLLSMRSANVGARLIERIRREDRPGYRFAMADIDHDTHRLEGYLKGFMDLVVEVKGRYYILDWKSNFLSVSMPKECGDSLNDFLIQNYSPEAMAQAIQSHGYALQYLLYTVALHRLLKVRLGERYDYDRHFGGVFYLFVRGVRTDLMVQQMPCGVWSDRPSRGLIEDLDAILGGVDG
jgi:exodeoxyribonuclease V beta subunit